MHKFFLLLIFSCILACLASCSQTQAKPSAKIIYDPIFEHRENLTSFEKNVNEILARIENEDLTSAENRYSTIDKHPNNSNDIALLSYTHAKLLLKKNEINQALEVLNNPITTQHILLSNSQTQLNIGLLNSEVLTTQKLFPENLKSRLLIAPLINEETLYRKNHYAIWEILNSVNVSDLKIALKNNNDYSFTQWVNLNIIFRNNELTLDQKIKSIDNWLSINPTHPASAHQLDDILNLKTAAIRHQEKIAILLPFNGKYSAIAEAIRDGFLTSYFKMNSQNEVRFYNANENEPFLGIYNQAIKDGATLVIGPLLKNQLDEINTQDSLPVKTLALNRLSTPKIIQNLYQFSLAPEDEITSIANYFSQLKYSNIFILAQNDDFSQKNMSTFIQIWRQLGKNIISSHTFSETSELASELESPLNISKSKERTGDIQNLLGTNIELNPKSRTDIDTVLLFTKPDNAKNINMLLNSYMPNNIAKYSTSSIYRGFPNPNIDHELNGIAFTDMPFILQEQSDVSGKYKTSALIRMYAFGIDAHELGGRLLNTFTTNITTGINGATGNITLSNNEFTRKTDFAIFVDGIAIPIPYFVQQ